METVTIATSDDGKVRIYSWDTEMGGTMTDLFLLDTRSGGSLFLGGGELGGWIVSSLVCVVHYQLIIEFTVTSATIR